jgi:hypothetical protein
MVGEEVMKDKELREKFEILQEDHAWAKDLVDYLMLRVSSLENYIGVKYEYVKPLEGKYIHRKVEPSE